MAVDGKTLENHPGRNPDYAQGMAHRKAAQKHNKEARELNAKNAALGLPARIVMVPVPRAPNKYLPHVGAKERQKARASQVLE